MYRQALQYTAMGTPVSVAVIYAEIAAASPQLQPVCDHLRQLAAQGTVAYFDDTSMPILNFERECIFHVKPIRVSTPSRSLFPFEADHGFHRKAIKVSTASRSQVLTQFTEEIMDRNASSQIINEKDTRDTTTQVRLGSNP